MPNNRNNHLGRRGRSTLRHGGQGLLFRTGAAVLATFAVAGSASAATIFTGNLVVSSLTYQGSASTITVGQKLPNCSTFNNPCTGTQVKATNNGSYGQVFQNDVKDGNFGITAPYALQFYSSNGKTATLKSTFNIPSSSFTGSFSSKSEGAINVSPDGRSITLMGYNTGQNQIDISNSNTPTGTETGNTDIATPTYRTIAQVNSNGTVEFTDTNAYSGNNGRAVILGSDGNYYTVGNAGNGNGDGNTATLSGVQRIAPGSTPSANGTPVGSFNAATQEGISDKKPSKDNNYRGETIFDNTLYVTKGSGSNGIDTVYQVGTAGSLPSSGSNNPITVLPGFPVDSAKTNAANFYPFGLWFANSTTLYVADEGDGTLADAAGDANAGLEKWSFNGSIWVLDYTLQNGLDLGQNYTVTGTDAAGDSGSYTTATDGLRNIIGEVNKDGTVTIFAVTSTASNGTGDPGADPDKLVAIEDVLGDVTAAQSAGESFNTLETAAYGEVLRGVALVAVPEPDAWALMMLGLFGLGAMIRAQRKGRSTTLAA